MLFRLYPTRRGEVLIFRQKLVCLLGFPQSSLGFHISFHLELTKMVFRNTGVFVTGLLVFTSILGCSEQVYAQESQQVDTSKEDASRAKLVTGSLKFRSVGPAFMSGRIGDLAIDPVEPNTWYVAVASGGLWKTTNAGTTFTPIFDNKPSYSMGCVSIDPLKHTTVWLGTGENNGGRHIGFGDGIYVSHDSGKSWQHKGLKESEHISKILVDPRDSKVVFAASQGPLWSPGGQRGLFKSTDGGIHGSLSWVLGC